ncbi:MAG: hypothetical protein AAGJ31_15485, partial [Verrucomicrobiota bacterium]
MATGGIVTGERQKAHTRYVDMWVAAGLHPTNIEILTKLKSAEDRQFSKNMGVTGKAFEEDRKEKTKEETHLFGIRTDIWKPSPEERKRALTSLQKRRSKELRTDIKKSGGRLNAEQKAEFDAAMAEDETMNLDSGDIDKARLVLKMFRNTASKIRWMGTLEELTVRELQHS